MSTLKQITEAHREMAVSAGYRYMQGGRNGVARSVLYGHNVMEARQTAVEKRLQALESQKQITHKFGG